MKIVIVGGGSAGWISAIYLDRVLNGTRGPKHYPITLIESPQIGRIGVGEATVPTLLFTLAEMGVGERDFLRAADATFKQAIKFEQWRADPMQAYYHPFDRITPQGRDNFGLHWANSDMQLPFSYTVSAQPAIVDAGLAPKSVDAPDYAGQLTYAYHMDAEKFAGFLAELGQQRGITHVLGNVNDVHIVDNGNVASVEVTELGTIAGDYFVDCTGFARVLMSQLQGMEWNDFSPYLLCDRAVAIQVPHSDETLNNLPSCTTAQAQAAGWTWDIGLQSRRGTGYVYSSNHLEADEAEAQLRAKLGPIADDASARHLSFKSGHLRKPWVNNCVAIGLSAGFVEPMESTGIYFVEYGVKLFAELLPLFGSGARMAARYNQLIADRYEEVLSFIAAHYVLSDRRDTPFWQDATQAKRIPPHLRNFLDDWQEKLISKSDFANSHQLFGYQNYEYCVYGMGWRPDFFRNRQGGPVRRDQRIARVEQGLRQKLPKHADYFRAKGLIL